jgi:Ser/Thr protein kinase RdoA (MazF antagonist)
VLATWCQHRLGARPVETVFRAGHLSLVVGLRLADGQRVVVKVRPPAPRVHGCVAVQRALAAAGFPCPRPLAGPDALAGALVTAEELVPGGEPLADGAEAAARLAGLLAELVAAAPPVAAVPSLRPAPPWVGWDHDEPRLWPAPDDLDEDLNDHPGPEWLDRAAVRVRARLAGLGLPSVVGHGDWESQNVRWRGGQAVAVHDWDSVVAQPEAAIAGQAAAVWPVAGPPGEAASVEQTDRFLAAYERSRGRPWTGVDREVAWAAGLWVRAFNAKKETVAGGGPQLDRLAGEVAERSRNAGI